MGEAGIFNPDARLELLEGSIYELPRIMPPHADCAWARRDPDFEWIRDDLRFKETIGEEDME